MSGPEGEDDDNVVVFASPGPQEYTDHQHFLDVVKQAIKSRDVKNTAVLVLDNNGAFTIHTSSGNVERNLAMTALANDHCKHMWMAAVTAQQFSGEDSDDGDPAA